MCTLSGVPSPSEFNGGTPMLDGLLCLAELAPTEWIGGWSYVQNGRICAIQGLNPVNGPFAQDGQLTISVQNTGIAYYWCGLPFLANGRMAVSFGVVPPPDTGAFSNAFSNAFDALEPA
jgi:hypothetical protein